MNAAIISNGAIEDYNKIKTIIKKGYDFIVCADGGARHAFEMNVIPDLIVGDFDSIPFETADYYNKKGIETDIFSKKKDYTDTHLAVESAIKRNARKIGLFGCRGTRADHTLANIQLLFYLRRNHCKGALIDEYNEIFLSEDKNVIQGEVGQIISLISVSPVTEGVTLKGFLYPLENATIRREDSIGISNELICKEGSLYKKEGDLLIIKSYGE